MIYLALFCPASLKENGKKGLETSLAVALPKDAHRSAVAGTDERESANRSTAWWIATRAAITGENRSSSSDCGSLEETTERQEPGHANTQERQRGRLGD